MKNQGFEHLYPQQSRHFSVVVVFFTSPFHLGGRHAKPFTRNLEGECARGGMNFVSVLPTISHELSYFPTSRKGEKRSQLNPRSLLSVGISPRLEIMESGGSVIHREVFKHPTYL